MRKKERLSERERGKEDVRESVYQDKENTSSTLVRNELEEVKEVTERERERERRKEGEREREGRTR